VAPAFVLDNPTEEADWNNFQATIQNVASGLGTLWAWLHSMAPSYGVR
jgi:hypothetical protein